jgi:uncharacterized membrane protein
MNLLPIVRFIALVATGLLAGIFLGDRMGLGFARPALPATSFVQLQQIQHVHFVRMMPVLQIAALLSTLTWLFLLRSDVRSSQFAVVALAAICLLVVFGLTMAINVPINNTLMTWNASAPPGDAMEIWKRWEQVNTVRAIISPIGFALQVLGLILA